jgi:hypothetical protein
MRGGLISVTSDGVVGTSGKATRVYGISILSGGTGAVVAFYNATSATGNQLLTGTGTANKAVMVPDIPAEGILFPAGLYVDVDTNTTQVNVWCEQRAN